MLITYMVYRCLLKVYPDWWFQCRAKNTMIIATFKIRAQGKMQSLDPKWLSKKTTSQSQFPTTSPIRLPTPLLVPLVLSMLFGSPVPCTNIPWHRLSQGRLWSSNLLPQIGTHSMCSAEIACPQAGIIQVCLDLYESRLRGNLFEQNLLLKTVCGMMV